MGYECPVCGVPQADAKHLANHLAFTAVIHEGDEHEVWLDDHVPGWGERGERELAEAVVEHADDADYPQVFEDTVGGEGEHQRDEERSGKLFEDDHGHTHGHDHGGHDHAGGQGGIGERGPDPSTLDPEARAVVEEAQELTAQRRRNRDAEVGDAEEADGDAGDASETERDADEE